MFRHAVSRAVALAATLLPLLLLVVYGVAFAFAALGTAVIGFDDHPGQLYRAWHVLAHGAAPWTWNPGWWAGYPELQFYPPGFAYLAAALAWLASGRVTLEAIYHALVRLAYLAPGIATWLALARLTRDGWLALPPAFVALTLAGSVSSGVEGGVRVGMVGARLAWALLALLLAVLVPWLDASRRLSCLVAPLLAAIVLLHPAQAPAAVALLAVAALASRPRAARAGAALGATAVAAGLVGFWTVPLLGRVAHTRALAWGQLTLADHLATLPLVLLALAIVVVGWLDRTTQSERVAAMWLPAIVGLVLLVRFIAEPLGLRWLPADRVADGAWMALIAAAGVGLAALLRAADARRRPAIAIGSTIVLAVLGLHGDTLMLWPRAGAWPSLAEIERGVRAPDLWRQLAALPSGRVLFVRSGVPLVFGTDWWRPHSHLTALTPRAAGERAIVGGTFTHPAPIAALVYRGDAGPAPVRRLAERLDGVTLFGEPIAMQDRERLDERLDRLGVVAIVALQDDAPALGWLHDDPRFSRRLSLPPFLLYARTVAVSIPAQAADGTWQLTVEPSVGGWTSARVAYYPLWRARAEGASLPTRRGDDGDLEMRVEAGRHLVSLVYRPGALEWAGVAVSAATLAAALVVRLRR
jgi:hypothetical protein